VLFVLGEANFSDHGANRLGASALMQGLSDGYFVIPDTLGNHIADHKPEDVGTDHEAFAQVEAESKERLEKLLSVKGKRSTNSFHKELGLLMWEHCGMARNAAGLKEAIKRIPKIREEFWENVGVTGNANGFNQDLENAGRVADFLEFAEVMCHDALQRDESCGGHFREEHQSEEGEAVRDDENFCNVSAWEFKGVGKKPRLHKEPLVFENVELTTRSYK